MGNISGKAIIDKHIVYVEGNGMTAGLGAMQGFRPTMEVYKYSKIGCARAIIKFSQQLFIFRNFRWTWRRLCFELCVGIFFKMLGQNIFLQLFKANSNL